MRSAIAALARQDLKVASRDTLMVVVLLGPFMYAMALWFVPAASDMAARTWDFDLTPYYPLIVSSFCVLGPAVLLGAILGLQLLDERDQRTLLALRVTPLPPAAYPAYRGALMITLTVVSTVAALAITGLVPGRVLAASVPIAVVSGWLTASFGMLMSELSSNKVEGMAVVRVLGMATFTLPAIPFFVLGSWWEYAFWILPPYWPARAFWAAWEGAAFWPYVLGGLVVNAAAALLLVRAASRRAAA